MSEINNKGFIYTSEIEQLLFSKGDLKMATKAKRPREENIYDEENRIQCEQRAKTFLKWFSSNPNNFFNDKVFVYLFEMKKNCKLFM